MAKTSKEAIHLPLMEDKIQQTILDSRRIFISDGIDNEMARDIIDKIWYLELTEPGKPILIVLNCPGGSVDSGFAIWDQLQLISSPVATLVTGLAASMGSVLSLAAKKGRRFATPMSRIMIHQPLIAGVVRGQATDLDIQAQEILKTRDRLVKIYVNATGKDEEVIRKAIERDTWMTTEEAKQFGLIDKIIDSYEALEI